MNAKCIRPMDNVLTNLVCRSTISRHTVGTLTHTCPVSTTMKKGRILRAKQLLFERKRNNIASQGLCPPLCPTIDNLQNTRVGHP